MMICPFCQKEMEEGYIKNSFELLSWLPRDGKKSIIRGIKVKDEVKLAPYGCKALAYYCKNCSTCIIDANK